MTKKIAISVPDASLRKVKAAVRAGRAPSVSNYIVQLIENASAAETFDQMMASWIAESGASERDIEAARAESVVAFQRAGLLDKGRSEGKKAG
jgi:hypothetical protein